MGAELFYPGRGPGGQRNAAKAKAICATCPVQRECRDYALFTLPDEQRRFGICGGLTEKDRRKVRRELSEAERRAKEAAA